MICFTLYVLHYSFMINNEINENILHFIVQIFPLNEQYNKVLKRLIIIIHHAYQIALSH